MLRRYAIAVTSIALSAVSNAALEVPDPPRDFRGVWVATVQNIDWPSTRTLSSDQQKSEMIAILDKAAELRLNAIVFQVRPTCDAFYKSDLEPWSEFLNGKQGQAPEPFYDPLQFAIQEAHKRGLQLHAWLNPYRARQISTGTLENTDPLHVSKSKPDIVLTYGKQQWLDPTSDEALAHNVAVFSDLVKRYDLDGIHMDDYFYPYPVEDAEAKKKDKNSEKELEFPDTRNWDAYQKAGGKLSREDWRRSKVNNLVKTLAKAIKKTRPSVQFGISPFGIWRPGYPKEIKGFDQYNKLYADAKLWINEGWVDYFTPQLYWRIQDQQQSYPYLLKWWMTENKKNRHVWPGLYTGKIGTKEKSYGVDEIINQIILTRFLGANGNIHFSWAAFKESPMKLNDRLTTSAGVYGQAALTPPSPWIDATAPIEPKITTTLAEATSQGITVKWVPGTNKPSKGDEPFVYAVYVLKDKFWAFSVQPAGTPEFAIKADKKGKLPTAIAVAAVDRLGNVSKWATLQLTQNDTAAVAEKVEGQVK